MRYAAHEILVAPARPTASLRRLMAGIVLGVPLFLALSFGYAALLPLLLGAEAWARISPGILTASSPEGVLINLFTFGLLILALGVVLRLVHGRALASLVGPTALALGQFARSLMALMLLYALVLLVPTPESLELEPNLGPRVWVMFLPLALCGLFLQVAAEELVFRGYVQSQLAARFRRPLIWMTLPALTFGALHFDPATYGASSALIVGWAFLFGLAAADLTARFGTLGPATALHFVNNFSAILLAAPKGQFDGLALYAYPFSLEQTDAILATMPSELLILLCGWLAIRLALRG